MHLLRTNRALTVLVSLQPISMRYSRDADARDQSKRRVTMDRLVEVSSVQSYAVNKPLLCSVSFLDKEID